MTEAQQVQVVEHEGAPVPATESGSLLALIERAAKDPTVEIDKMERLFALHEKAVARQAESEFNDAMRLAQGKLRTVARGKFNEQTQSKYADLAAVNNIVMPVVSEYGLSITFGTDESPITGHIRITAEVSKGGFSKRYFADVPNDGVGIKGNANKTATHAFGSTVTYGRRYLLLLIFNISTADDDGNASSASTKIVTAEEITALTEEGEARAKMGIEALRQWWSKVLDVAERNAMMHKLEDLKTIAEKAKEA